MARLTPLSLTEARELAAGFGLDLAELEALDLGSVNSNFRWVTRAGQQFFARIYEEQGVEGAKAELRLLRDLDAFGVPVTLPLRHASGGDVALVSGKALSVYQWRDGIHLCNALVTPERTHQLGAALAKVHAATPTLSSVPAGRFGLDGLRERLARIREQAPEFAAEAARIEQRLDGLARARDATLPRGLVHGDLFRDNVLWQGPELVALLDFESASVGPFVYDVAVCLLSWCYTDGFRKDCALALLHGYQSVRPLSQRERENLALEASIACLRFATTRITDFAMRAPPGTPPKRDFRRFLARLDAIDGGALAELVSEAGG